MLFSPTPIKLCSGSAASSTRAGVAATTAYTTILPTSTPYSALCCWSCRRGDFLRRDGRWLDDEYVIVALEFGGCVADGNWNFCSIGCNHFWY